MEKNENSFVKKEENGDIILYPSNGSLNKTESGNIPLSFVTLSHIGCTIRWFYEFLTKTEKNTDEYEIDGKKYQATREPSGNVFLVETRSGSFVQRTGFLKEDILTVLKELQE